MGEYKKDDGRADERVPLPKLNLQQYDFSHPGVSHFLQVLEPDAHTFLTKCVDSVVKFLYAGQDDSAFHLPEVTSITIIVRPMGGVAHTTSNILDKKHKEIHISADYVQQLFGKSAKSTKQSAPAPTPTNAPPSGGSTHGHLPDGAHKAAKREIEGVIVHEMVHTMQYTGQDSCPGGLIEGMADWVRLNADLAPPHWKESPNDNKKWDSGYETTAYFLRWVSQHTKDPLFVPKLNEAFRLGPWKGGYLFYSVCGKSVEQAWDEYKKAHKV